MSKIEEAKQILKELGLPPAQQGEIAAFTLLALCGMKKKDSWTTAKKESKTLTKGIMDFVNANYRHYAPNSRETFRRQVLHQFIQAGIVDYNPDRELPITSPNAHYALTDEVLTAIKSYGTRNWKGAATKFKKAKGDLFAIYSKERNKNLIPLVLGDGKEIKLSVGKHNRLEIAIINEFAPRFAEGGIPLYIGDTAKKDIHVDIEAFKELGVSLDKHSKLPDVVLFVRSKNWLYIIEAVTSHGPISPKRLIELEEVFKNCTVGKIYVTAFSDFTEFRRHISNIAWETEVWIAENPSHLIHFNGDRFLGPR